MFLLAYRMSCVHHCSPHGLGKMSASLGIPKRLLSNNENQYLVTNYNSIQSLFFFGSRFPSTILHKPRFLTLLCDSIHLKNCLT